MWVEERQAQRSIYLTSRDLANCHGTLNLKSPHICTDKRPKSAPQSSYDPRGSDTSRVSHMPLGRRQALSANPGGELSSASLWNLLE